jgi:predicted PurR-regulated permease PerM
MNVINYKLLNRFIYITTLIVVLLFLSYVGFFEMILGLLSALTPFYLAFFIAWIMRPLGKYIHKRFNVALNIANFLAIIVNIAVIILVTLLFVPFIIQQIVSFTANIPDIVNGVKDSLIDLAVLLNIDYQLVSNFLNQYTSDINFLTYLDYAFSSLGAIFSFVGSTIGLIFQIVFGYIIAFYFINDIKSFFTKTLKLFNKKSYEKNLVVAEEVSDTLYGYTRGVFLVCSAIFIMVTLGCMAIGLPNAALLGLIAALFNVIPYIGPILGGIPVFLVALSVSLPTAAISLIVVFGSQFVEANLLQPRIMAKQTNLRPTTIIVGLFLFANLFGFVGVLISTPCLAAIGVILKHSKLDITI